MIKERARNHRVNYTATAIVLKTLMEGPASVSELVDAAGLRRPTVYNFMRVLKAHKLVHIAAWERDRRGCDHMPVFAFGEGRDKQRRKTTGAERAIAYRERKRLAALGAAIAGAGAANAPGL